jgi:hypothetical protein
VVSYQQSAISYQQSAISYQLSAISYQQSTISSQLFVLTIARDENEAGSISFRLTADS